MISLKDYAKKNHITYEAVRSQVNRYREQLDDHIVQDGRTQYLDDIAVAFLDERRQKNRTVIYQQDKDERIEELERNEKAMLAKIAAQAERIADLTQFKLDTLEERRLIEASKEAQARRELELNEREGRMDQEISEAAQKAAEDARRAAEEEKAAEVARIQQEADKQLVAAEKAHQKEMKEQLGEKDRRIQELENRTFGDYLKGLFRKKGKV